MYHVPILLLPACGGPEIFSPYMKVGHPTLTTRGIASLSMEYQARHEFSASVWLFSS